MNLTISKNQSIPSFGIKTDSKVITGVEKVIAGSAIAVGSGFTVNELVNRARIENSSRKPSLNSLINTALIKDWYSDKRLKLTFEAILTEIESRPEIQQIIKREEDSEFLSQDDEHASIIYEKNIKLSDGRNVKYKYIKGRSCAFSRVYLLPSKVRYSDCDYVSEFSIICKNGKSYKGWSYKTYKEGHAYDMTYKDNEPDYITPKSK